MTQTPDPDELGSPSPVSVNDILADRFLIGTRYGVRGDVHLHYGTFDNQHSSNTVSEYESVRIAVFRYRGAEPLPRFLEYLRTDAEEWGQLRSVDGRLPVIVPTLDVGRMVNTTTCYWVQEDPRGPSLLETIDRPHVPRYALHLTLEIGAALKGIHRARLVHGDLDPLHVHLHGNLDVVRLSWGGFANRLEAAGMDTGRGGARTLAEVAPEVLQGRWWDPRSDLYGLAALLFRMLSGQPPWLVRKRGPLPGVSPDDPLPPLPEWVNGDLVSTLSSALSRDPYRRPDLDEWLDRITEIDSFYADQPLPPGCFSPLSPYHPEPMPPSLNRTLSPTERLDEADPALSNTPAPTHRMAAPPVSTSYGIAAVRSIVPTTPRSLAPPSLSPSPALPRPPEAAPISYVMPIFAFGSLGFGLGMLMLVVMWLLVSPFLRPPQPIPQPQVAVAPAPPADPAPVVSARPVFSVWTDPPGATLWEGTHVYGQTPIEIPLTGTLSDPPRVFELKLEGYAPLTVQQPYSPSPVFGRYVLQKDASRPTPAPVAPQLTVKENRER